MAKDYKKIYLRLKSDTEKQIKLYNTYLKPLDRCNFLEQIELNETIITLGHFLRTMEELEGKEHSDILFNEKEFKNWKRKITK